ncbi:aldo/keto reductase [Spiractinospora alimapuensis]|uniref:aldo/keto reductase n=1 Tax=Spiractinospora alimapuensis TaxID=2820884 RepID=UPI001F1CC350|nr:aldo/keto reductase [Spiractinospora alimapuensis]QVQ52498.1 aldo/keto reductase [Spiractinospora alimapuensis]
MEQRQLGGSGLWVSQLALGTMTWGKDVEEDAAADQLAAFVEAGGTLVDTADIYADGASERLVGDLTSSVVRRGDVLIASKAGHSPRGFRPHNTSRHHLMSALDQSLSRLRTDYIDLWQLHVYDPTTPVEETMAAVDTAVASGRVRYVGVAGVEAWQWAKIATWQRAGASQGRSPVVSAGTEYSLLNRVVERDLLPAVDDAGASLLAWSPLGRGVLTGKYRSSRPVGSRGASRTMSGFVEPYLDEVSGRIVESVCTAADGLGVSPLAVALSWVMHQPRVASAVVGARTAEQLTATLDGTRVALPEEIRSALSDVSGIDD